MNYIVNATSLDMTLVQGNSRAIVFNVKGSGIAPIDLSNVEDIRWSFFRSLQNNSPVVEKSLGSGIEVDDQYGIFTVTLVPDDTRTIPDGNYFHEAVIILSGGEVYTVVNGNDGAGKFTLRKIGTSAQ